MNREILFRGKRVDNGKWVYGWYFHTPEFKLNQHNILNIDDWCDVKSVIPETVGQYIGLTDKNGRKIFEGDIVKTKYGRLCQVVWFSSPCHQGWDLIPLEDKHKCPDEYDIWRSENLEVIGNVHDNSDLLNE